MGMWDDFKGGLGVLGDLYQGNTQASMLGQPVRPGVGAVLAGLGQGAGQFVGETAAMPKQAFRAGVGLDPGGSAVGDLQNLGVGRVPAAWIGTALDVFGDPAMMAGMAQRTGVFEPALQRTVGAAQSRSALLNALDQGTSAATSQAAPATSVAETRLSRLLGDTKPNLLGDTPPAASSPLADSLGPAPTATPTEARLQRVVGQDKWRTAFPDTPLQPAASATDKAVFRANRLLENPALGEMMTKVPPGSQFVGAGDEAMVFGQPGAPTVVRLDQGAPSLEAVLGRTPQARQAALSADYLRAPPALPPSNAGLFAQPLDSSTFGNTRASVMPRADRILGPADQAIANVLRGRLQAAGLPTGDFRPDQIGMFGNRPLLLDANMH
jgi:hypothetical protein